MNITCMRLVKREAKILYTIILGPIGPVFISISMVSIRGSRTNSRLRPPSGFHEIIGHYFTFCQPPPLSVVSSRFVHSLVVFIARLDSGSNLMDPKLLLAIYTPSVAN